MLHIQDVPLGLCANPYVPQKKFFWGSLIGSVVSGLFGLGGNAQQSVYTKEQQRLQSKLNREEQSHSMALQKGQQEWLNNTQYGAAVSGMKNAGLNPAMAGGGSVGAMSGGSAGHPSSGAAGPAAHGEGLGSAVAQGAAVGNEIQLSQKRLENETKVANAQANALNAQATKDSKTSQLTQLDIDSYQDRLNAELEERRSRSENYRKQSALYGQQYETEKVRTKSENAKFIGYLADNELKLQEFRLRDEANKREWISIGLKRTELKIQALHFDRQDRAMFEDVVTRIYMAENDAAYKEALTNLNTFEAEMISKYGDAEHIAKIFGEVLKGVGDVAMMAIAGRYVKGAKGIWKAGRKILGIGKKK